MATLVGMSQPSVLYQLVEARLGGSLVEYVAERRANTSWRTMAAEISESTGVAVNHETLRLWFADRIQLTAVVIDEPAGAA